LNEVNSDQIVIRGARVEDARAIKRLIDIYAATDIVLPRSLQDVYVRIRDFWVAEQYGEGVIACVALQMMWESLAEIRSLVVDPRRQTTGLGRRLVVAALAGTEAGFCPDGIPGLFPETGICRNRHGQPAPEGLL